MRGLKKIILGTLAVVLLAGATPALAQLAGAWEGTGTGSCPNPFSTPPESMLPWRSWYGEIRDDEEIFKGEWHDPLGFHGNFRGEATIGTPDEVVFVGTWTAIDDSVDPPYILEMGTFSMHFRYGSRACEGKWWTYDSDLFRGTMQGRKI